MNKLNIFLAIGILFLLMGSLAIAAEINQTELNKTGMNKTGLNKTGINRTLHSQLQAGNNTQERQKVRLNNASVDSDLNVTRARSGNQTKLMAHLSNGKGAEIKIMPETASETALMKLRLKVCNESNNCTIQLKEVGKGNETRAAYELQIERHAKIIGLFKTKVQNRIQIDSETGEVILVNKPWWMFLASESD